MTTTLPIDDRNPLILYSSDGGWTRGGILLHEYLDTSTGTSLSAATAKFTFSGTGVSVWGTVPNDTQGGNIRSSYAIDGDVRWTQVSKPDANLHYQQRFFQSDPLSANISHELVITNLNDNSFLLLDYILLTTFPSSTVLKSSPSPTFFSSSTSILPIPMPSSPSVFPTVITADSSSTLQTSTPESSASQTLASETSAPALFTAGTTPSPAQSSARGGPPLGVVLGVGIGSLVLLLITTLLLWRWSNRKKLNTKNISLGSSVPSPLNSRSSILLLLPEHGNLTNDTVYDEGQVVSGPPPRYDD